VLVTLAGVANTPRLCALGLIHRHVRVLHQLFVTVGVLGEQRDADTGGDAQVYALDREGLADGGEDLVGHQLRAGGVAGAEQQHTELIAAQTRSGVGVAQHATQALAYLAEQLVAGVVTKGVVELLEAVKIEQQQRQARLACAARA